MTSEYIINSAVRNLKDYGYKNVTPQNIIIDKIYSPLFKEMLSKNKGQNEEIDKIIDELLTKIDDCK